ncbi:MAG: FHA domain-containing protein [Isosphaeraceae bacterium]
MRARLVSLCGHPTIHLTKTMTLVGRQDCCDVRIGSSRISRCHCCLVIEDGEVIVRDLNSTNGTHVNGRPVASSPLLHGDVLAIGHLKYRVTVEASTSERPSPGDASQEGSAEDHPTALEIELPSQDGPGRGSTDSRH